MSRAAPLSLVGMHVAAGSGELLSRARAGDAEAFRVIFDQQAPGVRRFLGDLLRDDSAADEGTQETFVRAWNRLHSLEQVEKLQGWLFGIARMVFLEQLRRKRREPLAEEDAPIEMDRAPSPETALLGREADKVLERALATLGEDRRAALVMRLDHDLAYGDIAEAMGWPLQKVKNEIHRARLQLRERIQQYLAGEPAAAGAE